MKILSNLRNRMRKNVIKNERGQGATEYILLLVVVVGLVLAFGGKIKTAFNDKVGELTGKMGEVTAD